MALGVSFLCSILEAVLLSTTMPFIETNKQSGKKSAILLKKYKTNIDRPLSAILSLNTVAHTVGAAGVGAQAVKVFGEMYFGLVSAILTILILIITEIIPKTIGSIFWRNLALVSARILRVLIIIVFPLVILAEQITQMITKRKKPFSISREEVAVMANLGEKEGVFEEAESKVINNMIKLKKIRVNEIMTPRTVIIGANQEMTLSEFFKNEKFLTFSRIPVYEENIDQITGYVLKDTILSRLAEDKHDMKLAELKRPIVVSYENLPIPNLFEQLLYKKEHISLVIDEYGGTKGLVTMEDVIETLLGLEIVDESDIETDMQKLAKERWLKIQKKRK